MYNCLKNYEKNFGKNLREYAFIVQKIWKKLLGSVDLYSTTRKSPPGG